MRKFKHERLATLLLAGAIAALGAVSSARAGNVDAQFAKGGKIHLTSSISLEHQLIIPANTQLSCDAGVSISDKSVSKPQPAVVQVKGSNISIDGCDLLAQTAQVVLWIGPQTTNLSLTRNHFHSGNHSAHGIVIDAGGISAVRIQNNQFEGLKWGILQNVHAADVNNVIIDGNTFDDIWADGVALNDPVTVNCCGLMLKDVRASNVKVTNNKFRIPKHQGSNNGAGFCVSIAGAYDIEVSGNDCIAWHEGVHIEDRAYNIKVINNSISTNDTEGHAGQSAVWAVDGKNLLIANNKIKDAAADGIHLDYDVGHSVSDSEVTGNEITGCKRYGLYLSGGSNAPMNTKVHDNTVSGCGHPVYLLGKLQTLSVHSNKLESRSGCALRFMGPNQGDVDIKGNVDVHTGGDANGTCVGAMKPDGS